VERLPGGAVLRRAVAALRAVQRAAHPRPERVHQGRPVPERGPVFNRWLDAPDTGDTRLERIYRRRFRARFVPAFRAWIAEHPVTNRHARPSPLYEPNYRIPEAIRAAALDAKADKRNAEGTKAKDTDDKYILSTVFFAVVLFFSGISLRLDWRPLRIAVMCFAATMLLGGFIFVLTLDFS
jgi:hypothetical protein